MEVLTLTDKELLQELMRRNNWNQSQLAREMGFKAHANVSYVMSEKSKLSGASRKLAEILLERSEEE